MNYDGQIICAFDDRQQVNTSCRWPSPDVSWSISRGVALPKWTFETLQQAIDSAWSGWSKVCGIRPRFVGFDSQANLNVFIAQMDGAGQVLADCELPCGASMSSRLRMRIDQSEAYVNAANPPGNVVDLVRTVRHELGHGIGIPHIANGNLMAPVYSATIRDCQVGDIAEAVARYGIPQPDSPPPVDPPSTSDLQRVGEILRDSRGILTFRIL